MKTLTPVIICAAVISIAPHLLAAAKDNAPVPATNRLEKIRIAPDGKSFVTASGKPYAPVGLTYFRANTGWAPQVWKQFDAAATRRDFAAMKELGVNCVRVFISFTSFCDPPGQLNADGIAKFDEFLKIAEEAGIYVHPTGPDLWEGIPEWARVDQISDEKFLQSLETFWSQFAKRYAGRNVIFAYDLRNEPAVPWKATPAVQKRWSDWLLNGVSNKGTGSRPTIGIDAEAADCERACPLFRPARYPSREALAKAWGVDLAKVQAAELPPPEDENKCGKAELLDYQLFREDLADEWTRRQVKAIKAADPAALCTVGFIQWSVPTLLPGLRHYAAFRPERQAPLLDFLEIHFYPFAEGAYDYRSAEDELKNLAYFEGVIREVARCGKPVVLAEFGWYGGGKPRFERGIHPASTEEQQAQYCRRVVETGQGLMAGWLNWGLFDAPEATDPSQFSGLLTADGKPKAWGRSFSELASRQKAESFKPRVLVDRPALDWNQCLIDAQAAAKFRQAYFEAFRKDMSN